MRICEVIKVNPIQILIYTLIFANIGGAITPIGDPPNVIIASNPDVMKAGITFGVFTLHTGIGACIILFIIYLQIRIMYRDIKHYQYDEPEEIKDLKREIAVWERTAASVSSYSKDENIVKESLLKQMAQLQNKLKDTVNQCKTASTHVIRVENLKKQYPIKNKSLLIKSGITLALVICLFFFNSIPAFRTLGLGWTALLGVILLLILYDSKDLDAIFARVEWSTLLFFASLFILMEVYNVFIYGINKNI
uniref:P protein-like n=1 Tax=Diabrotica virgifera virgifera TaxID=50390 RepID=A0A6P7FRF4_DIAVI